ncbi:hypothetical protein BaRGS_00033314 [Batillaria attramentaria]|uniref:Uncharacterized protein n=1 Tax=Batillaria attramentaria TaxID=370345 RepID=A0ABD0JKB6_9CAEN
MHRNQCTTPDGMAALLVCTLRLSAPPFPSSPLGVAHPLSPSRPFTLHVPPCRHWLSPSGLITAGTHVEVCVFSVSSDMLFASLSPAGQIGEGWGRRERDHLAFSLSYSGQVVCRLGWCCLSRAPRGTKQAGGGYHSNEACISER